MHAIRVLENSKLGCKTQWPPDKNPVPNKYPVENPTVEKYSYVCRFAVLGFKPKRKNPTGFNILDNKLVEIGDVMTEKLKRYTMVE